MPHLLVTFDTCSQHLTAYRKRAKKIEDDSSVITGREKVDVKKTSGISGTILIRI